MLKAVALLFFLISTSGNLAAQDVQGLQNQVVKLIAEEKYKEALPIIQQLIEIDPDQPLYRHDRAVVNFQLKNYKASLRDYKTLSKEYPTVEEYYFQIGNIYENMDSRSRCGAVMSLVGDGDGRGCGIGREALAGPVPAGDGDFALARRVGAPGQGEGVREADGGFATVLRERCRIKCPGPERCVRPDASGIQDAVE
jgi:tetratricopeptide (TPR) repeat protein